MPSRLLVATFGAADPARLAGFWAELLGRPIVEDARGLLLPGDGAQLSLRFVASRVARTAPDRMHVHLTSSSHEHQQGTVATALRLGAQHLDVGQTDEEAHVVLADPEAYPFCVIEAGNGFLSGCGFLGELACEGTREVGVFWSKVLEWPLVWDQDEETAIQSPEGGTKIAWGGPPVPPVPTPLWQHLDLELAGRDLAAETDRLLALGATHVAADADGPLLLADPDGVPLRVLTD